jgi:regulator of replication initiation timing
VARSTGRLYSQTVYQRLLGAAGLSRRPSAQTWLKAIGRVRAGGVPPRSDTLPQPDHQARPEVQQRESSTHDAALLTVMAPRAAAKTAEAGLADVTMLDLAEWKSRIQIAETTARDAYGRIAVLEADRTRLGDRASAAEALVRSKTEQFEQAQHDHKEQTAALLARIDALAGAVDRMTGMERHLRLQTDQLRQELSKEAQSQKSRADAAEKALAIERSNTDAMRRILGNRAIDTPPTASASI